MMTAMTKIKDILDLIAADILPVKFKFMQSSPSSFPAACLVSLGAKEIRKDDISNEITESFAIRLIYTSEESEAGYEKWMTLVDALGAELRKASHITLGGTAVNFVIRQIPPPTGMDTGYSQPVVLFDIIVDAVILKLIH